MKMTLDVPAHFNFWRTVYSHGWCALPPFHVDKENDCLKRLVDLPTGKKLVVAITQPSKTKLLVSSRVMPDLAERKFIAGEIRTCLRIDEDYSEFYTEARKHDTFRWVPRSGAALARADGF
jgi:hypothetical protein